MSALQITLKGEKYDLATSLRVAYKIQGQHNHKPYGDVFKEIATMVIEQQIALLFVAFNISNPSVMTANEFLEAVLDEHGIATIMELISLMVEGIMYHGMSEEKMAEAKQKQKDAEAEQKMKANR